MKHIYPSLGLALLTVSFCAYPKNPVDKNYVDRKILELEAQIQAGTGANKLFAADDTVTVTHYPDKTTVQGNYTSGSGIFINGNVISASGLSTSHFVGEYYDAADGVIFWLDPTSSVPGANGLVVSVVDVATGSDWASSLTACSTYTTTHPTPSWRLPTITELQTLFMSQLSVTATSLTHGGQAFSENAPDYWSSTVPAADISKAWSFFFNIGVQNTISKSITTPTSVRCVRPYS